MDQNLLKNYFKLMNNKLTTQAVIINFVGRKLSKMDNYRIILNSSLLQINPKHFTDKAP